MGMTRVQEFYIYLAGLLPAVLLSLAFGYGLVSVFRLAAESFFSG